MKSYSKVLSIIIVCGVLLYGCGSMPTPGAFSQSSNSSRPARSTVVVSKKSAKQVVTRNDLSNTASSSPVSNSSVNSHLAVNHTEKERHSRILAAIKNTQPIEDRPVVSDAQKLDSDTHEKPNIDKPKKFALVTRPKIVPTKKIEKPKPIKSTQKKRKSSSKSKVKKRDAKFNEDVVKYNLANRYYQSGKYQNSIDILESTDKSVSTNVKNRDLLVLSYTAYARELVSKADLLEAQTVLEKALTMQPKNKTIQRQLNGIKNVREADKIYKKAIDTYNKGNRQTAFKLFSRVLALNPSHSKAKKYHSKIKTIVVDTFHKKALQYYRRQKLSKAIIEWNSLLKVDPGNDLARIYRSRAIELQKKFEEL